MGKKFGEFRLRSTIKSAPDGGQTDEILFDILNLRPLKRKTSNFERG